MRFPYHISGGVVVVVVVGPRSRDVFFAASYCGQRPQKDAAAALSRSPSCFESLFLLSLSLLRLRLQLWAMAGGEGGQTKPATAINNRRHAAASLCTICFLFLLLFYSVFGPPLLAANLHQQKQQRQLYALLLHRRFMLLWVFCVLRFALILSFFVRLSVCPFSAFHFTLKIKRNANANRQLSINIVVVVAASF